MAANNYLEWLSGETPTSWWHDSADPKELAQGKAWGAQGVTTNPVLASTALTGNLDYWRGKLPGIDASMPSEERAERLMSAVVKNAAADFEPIYEQSDRQRGYVCAQVNPAICSQTEAMLAMALRFGSWAPNISVKLPATAAGMTVLEECAAIGICVTSTVSFTVSQVVAAAEAYQRGRLRAERAGVAPAPCFAVIMIGRLDDYLREVVMDNRLEISEADLNLAGLAVSKRAYGLFRKANYQAQLLIAALRGVHHMEGLCGAQLVMSIHPKIQKLLLVQGVPRERGIGSKIPQESLKRLQTIPEFKKAYEVDGLQEKDFITFGLTQKTLSQFSAGGWTLLETLRQ